ncbi:MAG: BrnT family toxin [Calditrichaceae bacterium]|nr:BrnT family toxin [Calditrichaceae bacterium]MBN2708628.1 BrnT family toxin [Calditrichaceae bacterium]RQV95478.1 MAG: BrnT family toxin [Calditrichota bacterium]
MKYEWDEEKASANLLRHKVDFNSAPEFEWETAIETYDDRFDYDEDRWIALGLIGKTLHVLVYTFRSENIRIISLRKANNRERKYYETKTKKYKKE